jgi:hypothetical protein
MTRTHLLEIERTTSRTSLNQETITRECSRRTEHQMIELKRMTIEEVVNKEMRNIKEEIKMMMMMKNKMMIELLETTSKSQIQDLVKPMTMMMRK